MRLFHTRHTAVSFSLLLLLPVIGMAQPRIFYSDLESGPNSGGESDGGAWVTLYGERFGASQGNSKVTVGGGQVSAYRVWSDTKITLQLGSGASTGDLTVTTGTSTSNGVPFTVRAGNIYFVAANGSDANTGSFTSPWKTLSHAVQTAGASPGNIVYAKDGVSQTADDGQGLNAALSLRSAWCNVASYPSALISYPGATVTVGDGGGSGPSYGLRSADACGGNWIFAGINFRGTNAVSLAGPSSHWRFVGNDITCADSCFSTSQASFVKYYGNRAHDAQGVSFSTDSNHLDVGWNTISNVRGCQGLRIHSAGFPQFDVRIHDNLIHDIPCDGIVADTIDPSKGAVSLYNNVVYNAGTGLDTSPQDGTWTCISVPHSGDAHGIPGAGVVEIYNNTLYNCGSFTNPPRGSSNAGISFTGDRDFKGDLRNNIIYQNGLSYYDSDIKATQPVPYILILADSTAIQGQNNILYGNGARPSNGLAGSLSTDPGFVSPGSDFHLSTNSAAAYGGTPVSNVTDFDGIPLPQGSGYPIGAFAYVPKSGRGSLSVSPAKVTLSGNQTQAFTPAVAGLSSAAVAWSLNPAVGTLSSSGLYTAPGVVGAPQTILVTATSAADATKSASAVVNLTPISVSIHPASGSLGGNQTTQFTATVSGTDNTGVSWSLSPAVGTLSPSGLYTAPNLASNARTISVTATSVADPTKSATAELALASGDGLLSGMLSHAAAATTNSAVSVGNWYNNGGTWTNRKPLTIDHTKVSGTASLSNFAVLFSVTDPNLKTVSNGGNGGKLDGSDILFTASDGLTKLNHEIESYNGSTGQLTAWIKVPTVSPTTDTGLYIYYGNASAANQQNGPGVWDVNYKGIWHFVGGSATDSTSNGNNGTNSSATAAAGEIGGGMSFNGSNASIDAASGASLQSQTFTYEVWLNPSSAASKTVISQGIGGPTLRIYPNNTVHLSKECYVDLSGSTGTVTNSSWNHVAVTYDNSSGTVSYYINGSPAGSGVSGQNFSFNSLRMGNAHCYNELFSGGLDELRVSNSVRSSDWILTGYRNQSSPSTFIFENGQQSASQVSAPSFSPPAGAYSSAPQVTISTTTAGASIRYTTDGVTIPTATVGTLYSGPITVASTTTINAIAYKTGVTDSAVSSAVFNVTSTVGTPAFSPAAGTYSSAQQVTISTSTPGGSIRYTTDGVTTPTKTIGTLYSGPVTVGNTTTIKTMAFKTGMTDSAVNSAAYAITSTSPVALPAFSPVGGIYSSAQQVNLSTTTSGASIRYTTDGVTTPTKTVGTLYSGPVAVGSTTTIKAIAYKSGLTDSAVTSATYTIGTTANTAAFVNIDAATQGSWKGVYGANGYNVIGDTTAYPSYVTVTPSNQLSSVWSNSTTDVRALQKAASATDRIAARWNNSAPFTIDLSFNDSAQHRIALYCVDWDGNNTRAETISILDGATSAVLDSRSVSSFSNGQYIVWKLTGHVIIRLVQTGALNAVVTGLFFDAPNTGFFTAAPRYSPVAGTYSSAQQVTISTTSAGATIRYTTDGVTTPTKTVGTVYSGPLSVSSTQTIKAMAYMSGMNDSVVTSGAFTITPPAAAPTFSPAAGTYALAQQVSLSSATSGASIRYTTDGVTTPTETVGILYSGAITVGSSTTIKAIAYKAGLADSTVSAAAYTITLPVTHSVSLNWAASASTNVTGYKVYRSLISGGPYTLLTSSPVSATNYTDGTVLGGLTYYYVVTAVDSSSNESGFSTEVQVIVPLP